ncbi:hypothetical protein GCM10011318_02200 [Phaeocystidibacter marisrubri]|nr:hypothetical protein GCM10011318_02200 [Phaeocystidibacter marisrubri]
MIPSIMDGAWAGVGDIHLHISDQDGVTIPVTVTQDGDTQATAVAVGTNPAIVQEGDQARTIELTPELDQTDTLEPPDQEEAALAVAVRQTLPLDQVEVATR